MFTSKRKLIDTSGITHTEIEQIRSDLARGWTQSFQKMIVEPYSLVLKNFVQMEFPQVQDEAADIIKDVFWKIGKQIQQGKWSDPNQNISRQFAAVAQNECLLAIPSSEILQKNIGLSRKEFKRLVKQLQKGDEYLIEHFYLNHFKRCISYLIHQCQANYDDAYASTMEALLEIRKDLLKEKIRYGNLDFYFTKRARSKYYKFKIKKNLVSTTDNIEDLEPETEERIESDLYSKEMRELVAEGLQKLCVDCKKIIRLYYYEEYSLKEIAEILEKTHQAVRKQATRCRDKLRGHLGEQFYIRFSAFLNEE